MYEGPFFGRDWEGRILEYVFASKRRRLPCPKAPTMSSPQGTTTLYITKAALDQLKTQLTITQCDDELDQLTAILGPQI